LTIIIHKFVSADVGNQLKVKPNAEDVADDALMQQCGAVIVHVVDS